MYVADLALTDYRSYEQAVVSFPPGATVLVGSNGQGKTNLVESINYLATLSSHRVGADTALVRRDASGQNQPNAAVIRAKLITAARPQLLEVEIISGKANRARLNRAPTRPTQLLGICRTVLFAPEDLTLVRSDPQVRRRFLDDLVVMMSPRLAGVRADHDKVLAQRSGLLRGLKRKSGSARASALATLDVWDEQLAQLAAQLIAARVKLVRQLRPWVAQSYQTVSLAQSQANLAYRASLLAARGVADPDISDTEAWEDYENSLLDVQTTSKALLETMGQLRQRELERAVNLVGAHRDDLTLFLGHLPAKGFASHGEQWSLALALRLASFELMRADSALTSIDGKSEDPILILDDVFAELDMRRRRALSQMVAQAQQVLITAAVGDDVPSELDHHRLRVTGSVVSEV